MENTVKLLQRAGYGIAITAVAVPAMAAEAIDYSAMIAVPVATGAVAAIVAMGAVKIAPGFAKWAVNKVAGMFR
ncbi:hypothetical protein [Aquipseudomonas alcaligenes]|uniref:Uncharacterized protein n=1 Tax=Aquipseudomonas alcaligenes (strain ATCC 14909 / DSM 50342 / CCUG 1425 / JCM 20561 / NBRC 14159 / NCIMB 9945 / NCTC 10367 / 1577) TaxID=1215092 RepID=U3B4F3_AQUA1|nr:hypothetical protein [Pseudomonas alcaligenes]SUD16176.1 Uncharacterised protein [Pseudomonas alcaligenes]SUD16198.1 Uncharacterised protein [Pseudomonas alcaligenes]SUD16224.1 Uncharacterised protein [Pseudomonas alcaligenes]SUD16251.1 Uncharacterised protein [Pseudomonas alcaligenes]GAD64749.1 hypothetical protein PA6_046_00330 [Pseudomonas alcaligenes NBRC 14159]